MKRHMFLHTLLFIFILFSPLANAGQVIAESSALRLEVFEDWATGAVRRAHCRYDAFIVRQKVSSDESGLGLNMTVVEGKLPNGIYPYALEHMADGFIREDNTFEKVGTFGFYGVTTDAVGDYPVVVALTTGSWTVRVPYTFVLRDSVNVSGTYRAESSRLPLGGNEWISGMKWKEVSYPGVYASGAATITLRELEPPSSTFRTSTSSQYGTWDIVGTFLTGAHEYMAVRVGERTGVLIRFMQDLKTLNLEGDIQTAICLWDGGAPEMFFNCRVEDWNVSPYGIQKLFIRANRSSPGASLGSLQFEELPHEELYRVETVDGLEWRYNIVGDEAILYGDMMKEISCITRAREGKVTVPTTLGGFPIRRIASQSLMCTRIEELVIPEGVLSLDYASVGGCHSLISLKLPSTLTDIGEYALNWNEKLGVLFIPASVKSIGSVAFQRCASLLPYFEGPPAETVADDAFDTGPGYYSTVYAAAWQQVLGDKTGIWKNLRMQPYTPYMTEIIDGIEWRYTIRDGQAILFSDENAEFTCIPKETGGTVRIPATLGGCSVTVIPAAAFKGCAFLKKIIFSAGIATIERAAFSGCSGLTDIEMSSSVTRIGVSAFAGCRKLSEVHISASVTKIDDFAFNGCAKAQFHFEGMPPRDVGTSVFPTGNRGFYFPEFSEFWKDILRGYRGTWKRLDVSMYNSNPNPPLKPYKTEIVNGVEWRYTLANGEARLYATDNTACISQVTTGAIQLPFSLGDAPVLKIPSKAFRGCAKLTSITIPESVTSVETGAFADCVNASFRIMGGPGLFIGADAFPTAAAVYYTQENAVAWHAALGGTIGLWKGFTLQPGDLPYRAEVINGIIWTFNVENGQAKLYADTDSRMPCIPENTTGDLTIPSQLGGYPLKEISNYAFTGCSNLKSVTIPEGVTTIGGLAFSWCSEATSINIPSSVTSIGNGAFFACRRLTSVTIPEGVNSISRETFRDCTSLTSITIPSSVTLIENDAFYACESLPVIDGVRYESAAMRVLIKVSPNRIGRVDIPSSVRFIYQNSFSGCSKLTSVSIPSCVTSIGEEAFKDCIGLTSVTIPEDVTSIGMRTFEGCSNLTSVKLPSNLTSIGYAAFHECSSLTSVTIPPSVTSIDSSAFGRCVSLPVFDGVRYESKKKTVLIDIPTNHVGKFEIPSSVRFIHSGAFSGRSGLTSVIIPSGVTSIGSYAFSQCTSLTDLTIPSSVTAIGDSAFNECTGLTALTIPLSVTTIGRSAFNGCTGLTALTIPPSVTTIGRSAFNGCTGLTALTIPPSVTTIGDSAFNGCTGLTALTIPPSVTAIEESAFSKCTGLTTLAIPSSVTAIGKYAFYGCTNLSSVDIQSNKVFIDDHAFEGCEKLPVIDGVRYESSNKKVLIRVSGNHVGKFDIPSSVFTIHSGAFMGCNGLTLVTIPLSVTNIGSQAFYGCTGLTSIIIPQNVTSIGYRAFYDCSSLNSIKILSKKISVMYDTFGHTAPQTLSAIYMPYGISMENLQTVTILEGATSIPEKSFYNNSNLKSITIPSSVRTIQKDAFYGCTGLVSVSIPPSVDTIGNNAFYGCTGLTSITIPSGVSTLGDGAFYGCTNLASVTISSSVTTIGAKAFSSCTSLTSMTVPEGVAYLGNEVFSGCSGLTSIKIPASVEFMGDKAFDGCENLPVVDGVRYESSDRKILIDVLSNQFEHFHIPPSVHIIHSGAFSDCSSLTSLTIPSGVIVIGGKAFYGCTGLKSVMIPQNVKTIGDETFYGCSGLTSISIPNGTSAIGHSAFYGCNSLMSVTIPESVSSIGHSAFYGCSSLKSVKIPDCLTSLRNETFRDCSSLTSVSIPESVTFIGDNVFTGCNGLPVIDGIRYESSAMNVLIKVPTDYVGRFAFRPSVRFIHTSAFSGCRNLTSVTIPECVTSIRDMVFFDCSSLVSVTIPDGVTSIGVGAFCKCTNMPSVEIPESVRRIGPGAFYGCSRTRFWFNCPPIKSFYKNMFPDRGYGYYTSKHSAAWSRELRYLKGRWNGLKMSYCEMSPNDCPVMISADGPQLSWEDTATVKNLLETRMSDAIHRGVSTIKLNGSAEVVGTALDLGITPETTINGHELTAVFKLPELEILSFDPTTGKVRVLVVPASNTEIGQTPVETSIRVVGSTSLSQPMAEITSKKLNLTPYLSHDTKGEFEVTTDLKSTPFVRIEAGNPREVNRVSDTK